MPLYANANYTEFVRRAQLEGSGLGTKWHQDGALKALGALLRADSTGMQVQAAIATLARTRDNVHQSKLRKYRDAIAYVENTFPIARGLRQAPLGARIQARRYTRNLAPPTINFVNNRPNLGSFRVTSATLQGDEDFTVADFMEVNAASTRVLLVHLGTAQPDMAQLWDGTSALAHMNAVLATAAAQQIHVCILCDPHRRGRGVGTPTPANAVCGGLAAAVGLLPGTHVWVADGGNEHSAFHDPAFLPWLTAPGVTDVVVMGFDADICVRGNVFGAAEFLAAPVVQPVVQPGAQPLAQPGVQPVAQPPLVAPTLVSALINHVDVVTARPLLSGGAAGSVTQGVWGSLCFPTRDA
jgi:nicotinamidase-related amidase